MSFKYLHLNLFRFQLNLNVFKFYYREKIKKNKCNLKIFKQIKEWGQNIVCNNNLSQSLSKIKAYIDKVML